MIGPKCTNITGYPDEHHYVPGWVVCGACLTYSYVILPHLCFIIIKLSVIRNIYICIIYLVYAWANT